MPKSSATSRKPRIAALWRTLSEVYPLTYPQSTGINRGVFAWVTCHAVLERLSRDLKLNPVLAANHPLALPATPGKDNALAFKNGPLLVGDQHLVLEEFEFAWTGDANGVADWIARWAVEDTATGEDGAWSVRLCLKAQESIERGSPILVGTRGDG